MIVHCSAKTETTRPLTQAETSDLATVSSQQATGQQARTDRETRRQQAIDRLNAFVALGSGATAAQVRTESQFAARVLAKVLPLIDIDPSQGPTA